MTVSKSVIAKPKCIIYGAGKWGRMAFDYYKDQIDILFFIDSNPDKKGTVYCGRKVVPLSETSEYADVFVLVAVANISGVSDSLKKAGYKEYCFFTPDSPFDLAGYIDDGRIYYKYGRPVIKREKVSDLIGKLEEYDAVSFDIFDTAINRTVEFPADIFRILGNIKGHHNYKTVRLMADQRARRNRQLQLGNREVNLGDIYSVLNTYYGIPSEWADDEINLEKKMCVANPYILEVYNRLLELGKDVFFTSDMYLSHEILGDILADNGYIDPKVYVSNEYGVSKGAGGLFEIIKNDYPGKRIIHVGDNYQSDVVRAQEMGLDSYYYADSRFVYREPGMDTIDASFYRATVSNHMNCGLWDKSVYYEHGYRVGGILTAGYCDFINRVAESKGIDKILFCARDCKIIHEVYNDCYRKFDNEYIRISRKAALSIAGDEYFYDLAGRGLVTFIDKNLYGKTIESIFNETGFGFLADKLYEILDPSACPGEIPECSRVITDFLYDNKELIDACFERNILAAREYYKKIIGDAKKILIIDVGWSGTCITALKTFLEKNYKDIQVSGCLMCSSAGNENAICAIEQDVVKPYIFSSGMNRDLAIYSLPEELSIGKADYPNMALEFLFSSAEPSTVGYYLKDGNVCFEEAGYVPDNVDEIVDVQKGIREFVRDFLSAARPIGIKISPYVAYMPFSEATYHIQYTYNILKNYGYDVGRTPGEQKVLKFGKLFDDIFL